MKNKNKTSLADRILVTPSSYSRSHYLYVQEVGTLKSLEPHTSRRERLESYLFFIVLEGSGTLTFDGHEYPVSAGDCVWLDCQTPYAHESSAKDMWSLMWVHFYGNEAPAFYRTYCEREGTCTYTPSSTLPYIESLQALYHLQAQKNAMSDLYCHKHLTDLITQIFMDTFQNDLSDTIPQKFLDIREYIKTNYMEKLTLDDISSLFFISKYHLSREYQKLFSVGILTDLTISRLSHAKSLLRFSTESIEEIATSCGFQTSTYFIKVFKKYENLTPLEYRHKW